MALVVCLLRRKGTKKATRLSFFLCFIIEKDVT